MDVMPPITRWENSTYISHLKGGIISPWQSGQSGQASPALSPDTAFPQIRSMNRRARAVFASMPVFYCYFITGTLVKVSIMVKPMRRKSRKRG